MLLLRCWLLLSFILAATVVRAAHPLWVACGPAELVAQVRPLAELRKEQGMETRVLPGAPADVLKGLERRPDFLVIVGDDVAGQGSDEQWVAPSARVPFSRWSAKQRPDFASDLALAGLSQDALPLCAVGRLPARSPQEVRTMVQKILAWEGRKTSRADLALPMWAGDPAYDPKFTEIFMGFLFAQINRNAPEWLEPWIVSGDPAHPLCGWPAAQPRVFDERTAGGGLFIGMMGHGGLDHFCSVKRAKGWQLYHSRDARELTAGGVRPPQVIFACECGWFDSAKGRSLAEELLLAPAGPVLTVAATNESHPLTNFYTATNLLRRLRDADGPLRFGPWWIQAQKDMLRRTDFVLETMLKGVEGNYAKPMDPRELKRDQASLYAILGDPATSIHAPRKLAVKVTRTGAGWRWEATPPPGAGRLTVEYRESEPVFEKRPVDADEATSRAMFAKASAALAFQPVPASGWSGEVSRKGNLRFVTEAEGELWVAGARLE